MYAPRHIDESSDNTAFRLFLNLVTISSFVMVSPFPSIVEAIFLEEEE